MPTRIQVPPRNERKGWRLPDGAKLATRASRWGNPFKIRPYGPYSLEESLALYRQGLFGDGVQARPDLLVVTAADAARELPGFDLGCTCPLDSPCHVDVLLQAVTGQPMDVIEANGKAIHAGYADDTANWGTCMVRTIELRHALRPYCDDEYEHHLGHALFCARHNCQPSEGEADLWGFATIKPVFQDEDNRTFWAFLFEVGPALGVDDRAALEAFWRTDLEADGYDDVAALSYLVPSEDRRATFPLVGSTAILRLALQLSPWAAELFTNLRPALAHGLLNSGLADQFTEVPAYQLAENLDGEQIAVPTGQSLRDVVAEDAAAMPLDEAKARAFRGPSGAFEEGRR